MKTKNDKFKFHIIELLGNELYFYRRVSDSKHRIMHCLAGTFIKDLGEEKGELENPDEFENIKEPELTFYPLKIILTANKNRILYF